MKQLAVLFGSRLSGIASAHYLFPSMSTDPDVINTAWENMRFAFEPDVCKFLFHRLHLMCCLGHGKCTLLLGEKNTSTYKIEDH